GHSRLFPCHERDRDSGATLGSILGPCITGVSLGHRTDDGETKAGSVRRPRPFRCGSCEWLEGMLDEVGGNPRTRVVDDKPDERSLPSNTNTDMAAGRRVLKRVTQKVIDRLSHPISIDADGRSE